MALQKISRSLLNTGVADSSDATAITIDSSENVTFAGVLTANAGVVVDNITIDGTEIDSSGALTLDAAGQLNIDSGNSEIHLRGSGTTFGKFYTSGGDFYINHPQADEDIIFTGIDSSSTITALTLDMSEAGRAIFNAGANFGTTSSSTYAVQIQATTGGNALQLKGRNAAENAGWLAWTDYAGNVEAAMYATANQLIFANTTSYTETMRINATGGIEANTTEAKSLQLNSTHSNGPYLSFLESGAAKFYIGKRSAVGGTSGTGYDFYAAGGYDLAFYTNAARRWLINTSGHFTPNNQHAYDIGGTNAEVRNVYAQGISFASNANASGMTSELLDDYEEGTWTPVFGGNISATGQSYGVQEGTYTKIGRQVTCRFRLNLSAEGSFSNVYILLQGFPFALASSPGTTHLCNMYFTTLGANYISLGLQGHEGNAQAFIWAKKTATDNREYLGINDLTNTTQLTGTFTYFV